MNHSPLFGSCQRVYNANKDLAWLKKAVVKGAIRTDEYKEICGEDYAA
jgi:hypothetical protein